jgi:phosphoribosylanthranilate isomerase
MRLADVPALKICCIASRDEAALAIAAGASALGLVSSMPSGPGVIDDELIAEIAAMVPPTIDTFLLTSRQQADAIIDQQRRCRCTTLQLVDHVPHGELRRLRAALPGIRLVQVIHEAGEASLAEALSVQPFVDAVLLDSGNPALPVKQLGGTGRTHDWATSRRIRDALYVPLFLAGGLHVGNLAEAVAAVRPFGLDVCSGLRTDGLLDPSKLAAFAQALRATTLR